MSVLGAGEAFMLASGEDAGFAIKRSLRFNATDTPELTRVPSTAGNTKTFTISFWAKRSKLSSTQMIVQTGDTYANLFRAYWDGNDNFRFHQYNGSYVMSYITSAQYRDVGAWYHFVIAIDTTQAVAANRAKLYVNGVEVTDWTTESHPAQDLTIGWNAAIKQRIGREYTTTYGNYYNYGGYLAEFHSVDGQQLAPTDFGEFDTTTGVWNPIEYTHTITPTEAISYGVDNTSNVFDGNPGNYDTTGLSFGTWPGTIQNSNVGGYGANSVQVLKTNSGNAVTWTINTGNTNRYIHTSSDGINWTTNLTTISGTAVQVTSAWLGWGGGANTDYTTVSVPADNSFYLDFSDNSSNAALGDDRSRPDYNKLSGALTTTSGGGNFYSGTASRAFDGSTSSDVKGGWLAVGDTSNLIWAPPTGSYSVSSSLRVYAGYYSTISVNGASKATGGHNSAAAWITLSHTGAINEIKFENATNDNVVRISAIEIDGTVLVSNAWTVNNIVASSSNNQSITSLTFTGNSNAGNSIREFFLGSTSVTSSVYATHSYSISQYDSGHNSGYVANAHDGDESTNIDWKYGTIAYTFTNKSASYVDFIGNITSGGNVIINGTTYNAPFPVVGTSSGGRNIRRVYLVDPVSVDSLIDTPTDYEQGANIGGNYCTLNPLAAVRASISDGNLTASSTSSYAEIASSFAMLSGKWYCEFTLSDNAGEYLTWGVSQTNRNFAVGTGVTDNPEDYGFKAWPSGFNAQNNGSNTHNYNSSISQGDVFSLAFDADAGKFWCAVNGTWLTNGSGVGNPATGANPDHSNLTYSGGYYFMFGPYNGGSSNIINVNFGQRGSFTYQPPTGYKALCTQNFDDPLIADPSAVFNTVLYNGDGQSTQTVSGLSFNPDLIWNKNRVTGHHNRVFDVVRGFSKFLASDHSGAEDFVTDYGYITATSDTGFTVGQGTHSGNLINHSAGSYVNWCWDAGSSNTTVAVDANGSGLPGAECVYRVNTTAGFSIVRVANPTSTQTRVHGLNKKPDLIICKSTASSDSWHTYHSSLGYTKYINLNGTGPASSSDQFGSQEPTSTYFYVKSNTGSGANKSGGMIYYIWTAVEGYSAFGAYEGNGSSDGAFVYTGFRPAWILVKNADGTGHWVIMDSKRDVDNQMEDRLKADASDAESNTPAWDALSNGFKIRSTYSFSNSNSNTYIYAAFAENPFKTARAR